MGRTCRLLRMVPESNLRKNRVGYRSTSEKEIPKFENGTKYKRRKSRNKSEFQKLNQSESIDKRYRKDHHSVSDEDIPEPDDETNNRRRSSRIRRRTVEAESSKENVNRQRLDRELYKDAETEKKLPKFKTGTKYKRRSNRKKSQFQKLDLPESIDKQYRGDHHSVSGNGKQSHPSATTSNLRNLRLQSNDNVLQWSHDKQLLINSMVPASELWTNIMDNPSTSEQEIPKFETGTKYKKRSSRNMSQFQKLDQPESIDKQYRGDHHSVSGNGKQSHPSATTSNLRNLRLQSNDNVLQWSHDKQSLINSMVPESELWTNRMDNPSTPEQEIPKFETGTKYKRTSSVNMSQFQKLDLPESIDKQYRGDHHSVSGNGKQSYPSATTSSLRNLRLQSNDYVKQWSHDKQSLINWMVPESELWTNRVDNPSTSEQEIPKFETGTKYKRKSSRNMSQFQKLDLPESIDKQYRGDHHSVSGHDIKPTADTLLDNHKLTELLSREGLMSGKVQNECRKICKFIQTLSRDIRHVEPTYTADNNKTVTFLILAEKEDANLETEVMKCPWKLKIRIVNKYSDESRMMLHCKENGPIAEETSRKIAGIIDKYSGQLIKEHKYLSSISASSVKSERFGTNTHEILKHPCIILNVLVKGFIPLDENPFPRHLDGIYIDVREGGVQFCRNFAGDVLSNVRIGCKIQSPNLPGQYGTLGGFIEHPEYGLCAFTCAHVVLNDRQKADLKGRSCMKVEDIEKNKIDRKIYQPTTDDDNEIGKLVEVIYKEGENGRPGVDLAIFKIEKRAPTNGEFPDCSSAGVKQSYNTGLVWGKTGIPTGNEAVQKFGSTTNYTEGTIVFDNMVIKALNFHSALLQYDKKTQLTSTLHKQYQIKSTDSNRIFSDLGDSGALVFMKDSSGGENILRCIGMVEAVLDDSSCAVTPITAILDEMKISQLKSFKSNVQNQISKMLFEQMQQINQRFNKLEEQLKHSTKT